MTTTAKINTTVFISDLHLQVERPELTQAFLTFLNNQASKAQALYILGDFFNVWIGDDNLTELSRQISKALKKLAESGTSVFLMHGNRDFLIGEDFAEQAGAQLISQPYPVTIYNTSLLLTHGDSLCSKDIEYMQFRKLVHSTQWQEDFLSKSLAARQEFAEQARQQSKAMNSNKAEDIMDVTPEDVLELLDEYKVHTLIHGHTHRPAVHDISINGQAAQRIVLGDWDQQLWYLEFHEEADDSTLTKAPDTKATDRHKKTLKSTLEPRLVLNAIDIAHER